MLEYLRRPGKGWVDRGQLGRDVLGPPNPPVRLQRVLKADSRFVTCICLGQPRICAAGPDMPECACDMAECACLRLANYRVAEKGDTGSYR
jgi:hypothetical protein